MNFGKNIVSPDETGLTVVAMAKNASSKDNLKEEIKQLMRRKRHLKPVQKNNFSVDELSMVLKEVSKAMSVVNIVGWIIGGFSLLIGGFGIANIMFVSDQGTYDADRDPEGSRCPEIVHNGGIPFRGRTALSRRRHRRYPAGIFGVSYRP
jgi:hypothetical protein